MIQDETHSTEDFDETSVLDEMRIKPPTDRAGWLTLAARINEALNDAKSELAEAKMAARASGEYLDRQDFRALLDEVADLKRAHQTALLSASMLPRVRLPRLPREIQEVRSALNGQPDVPFLVAFKEVARSTLTASEYSNLIMKTKELVRQSLEAAP